MFPVLSFGRNFLCSFFVIEGYVDFSSLVHSFRGVLASRAGGAGVLPVCLGDPAAVSAGWDRGPRRFGVGLVSRDASGATAERAISGLNLSYSAPGA